MEAVASSKKFPCSIVLKLISITNVNYTRTIVYNLAFSTHH